jgi:hypothetical protein
LTNLVAAVSPPSRDERRAGEDRSGDVKRSVIVAMSLLVPADHTQPYVSTRGTNPCCRHTRNDVAPSVLDLAKAVT